MIGRAVFATAAFVLLTGPAAADANAAGFGLMACRDAVPLFNQAEYRRGILSWTLGFMSGVNGAAIVRERRYRDLDGLNADLVIGSLRATCVALPDTVLMQGAEQLWFGRPLREWRPLP